MKQLHPFIPKYDHFIETLRNIHYGPGTPMEDHHILPRFAEGKDSPENLIRISARHHTLAHYVRYKNFGHPSDLRVVNLRRKFSNEGHIRRNQLAPAKNKQLGQLFWDKSWQSAQGKKGGPIGGLANTEAQYLARQKKKIK